MTCRSGYGPIPCFVVVAALTTAFAQTRVAAAAQDAAPAPFAASIAAVRFAADPAADPETADPETTAQAAQREGTAKRADKARFRLRDVSLQYGRKFHLDFKTRMRGEFRTSDAAISKDTLDTLDIARRRIGVEGEILKAVAFKVDRELSEVDPWRDAYVDFTQLREAQFRYGQFKMPFSLDENTGSLNLDFAYRSSAATLLAPSRAKGWMVHGDTFDRAIGYEYGVFTSDGSNALVRTTEKRVNAGQTTVWRVTSEPLHGLNPLLADVHFGFAQTSGDVPEGISGIKGRTVLGAEFYEPEFYVFGRRQRKGFEFQWLPGPASVKMESITLTEERKGLSVEDSDLPPYQIKSWYVSGSYALTGERKARGIDKPDRPLFQGGFGALEVAVRVEKITFGSTLAGVGSKSPRADVLPSNSDRILSVSGNWYPNRWVKIQMTIFKEEFADPSTIDSPLQKPGLMSRVLRIQFSI